jgi:hypothetical protein
MLYLNRNSDVIDCILQARVFPMLVRLDRVPVEPDHFEPQGSDDDARVRVPSSACRQGPGFL